MAQIDPQTSTVITDDDKLWSLLSWIFSPLVPIIVLLLEDKKQRAFVKYNAIQALVVGVVGYTVSSILAPVFIGCITGPLLLIYVIYLGIQAYNGKWVNIPVITDFVANQGWIRRP
jgi:uncharacterized protein